MMQVILVNPDWGSLRKKWPPRIKEKLFPGNPEPFMPLELAYLAGILRDKYPVRIADLNVSGFNFTALKNQAGGEDLVFVLTTAPSYLFWRCPPLSTKIPLDCGRMLKRIFPRSKLIIIGPHASVRPIDFLSEADFILMGEPENAILPLVQRIEKNGSNRISGVVSAQENEPAGPDSCIATDDLDGLPFPAYDLFPFLKEYCAHGVFPGGEPKFSVLYEASRGCPFNCIFCFKNVCRNKFRVKNVEKTAQELRRLKEEFGVKYVYFIDETFGYLNNWTYDLCRKIKGLGLKWSCQSNLHTLAPELIAEMAGAGCVSIEFGLESGSAQVLKNIHKNLDREKTMATIEKCVETGITPLIFLLLGLPGDTRSTIKETREFMEGLCLKKCSFLGAGFPTPYPYTRLWHMGVQEGKIHKDRWRWEELSRAAGTVGNAFTIRQINQIVRDFNYYFQCRGLSFSSRIILRTKSMLKYHF
ncbi:MAG: radical SAM protein [Candidatus Omnitrophota bacterium]